MKNEKRPLVVEIKYNSLDDGPGIRTAVFLKGCPLKCSWCHNPETLEPGPETAWIAKDCIDCGECVNVCKTGAAAGKGEGRIDRSKCIACFNCVDACPTGARKAAGRYYETDDLLRLLLRDAAFYRNSGGGVTLTGGEPTLYMEYVSRLLEGLKEKGVHTLIETSGVFNMQTFKELLLPFVDMIYFDVKLFNGADHKQHTGVDNAVILKNLEALSYMAAGKTLPRIPLIPGVTATVENLRSIAGRLKQLGFTDAVLLPYNPLWLDKADSVGRPHPGACGGFMKMEEIAGLERAFFTALK